MRKIGAWCVLGLLALAAVGCRQSGEVAPTTEQQRTMAEQHYSNAMAMLNNITDDGLTLADMNRLKSYLKLLRGCPASLSSRHGAAILLYCARRSLTARAKISRAATWPSTSDQVSFLLWPKDYPPEVARTLVRATAANVELFTVLEHGDEWDDDTPEDFEPQYWRALGQFFSKASLQDGKPLFLDKYQLLRQYGCPQSELARGLAAFARRYRKDPEVRKLAVETECYHQLGLLKAKKIDKLTFAKHCRRVFGRENFETCERVLRIICAGLRDLETKSYRHILTHDEVQALGLATLKKRFAKRQAAFADMVELLRSGAVSGAKEQQ